MCAVCIKGARASCRKGSSSAGICVKKREGGKLYINITIDDDAQPVPGKYRHATQDREGLQSRVSGEIVLYLSYSESTARHTNETQLGPKPTIHKHESTVIKDSIDVPRRASGNSRTRFFSWNEAVIAVIYVYTIFTRGNKALGSEREKPAAVADVDLDQQLQQLRAKRAVRTRPITESR